MIKRLWFSRRRAISALTVGTVTLGLAAGVGFAVAPSASADPIPPGPGPVQQRTASNPTADSLPTWQIDGVVWSQVTVGNTVYAGGSFANARPPGTAVGSSQQVARANMLAYDITTGNLITSFNPVFDGQIQTVEASPDGSVIYVGGAFTHVNGQLHNHIAALTPSGSLINSFNAGVNSNVYAIAATNSTVYVGGAFSATSNNLGRTRLAAFTSAGAVTTWRPTADLDVKAMIISPDGSRLIVGGAFTNLNGSPVYGLGALDPTTGASLPFAANQTVQSYGTGAAFLTLATDGNYVYGTAYNYYGTGNIEGTFSADPNTGAIHWVEDCHGDTYDVFPINGTVYTVSHAHYCQTLNGWPVYNPWQERHTVAFTAAATGTLAHNTQGGYADFYGTPAPSLIDWYPDLQNGTYTSARQSAWSVTGNGKYLAEGGEFLSVNGVAQQGLVRFAVPSVAPNKQGPRLSGANIPFSGVGLSNGKVRLSWQADWDRDDNVLTYKVIRNGQTATPVYTTTATSQWWNQPWLTYSDTTAPPGSTNTYKLVVSDPDGNSVQSSTISVTSPTAGSITAYDKQVAADGASSYWPLGESSGTVAYDNIGSNDMDESGGVTQGAVGPVSGGGTATTFDGSSGTTSTRTATQAPDTFTVSAWVKTTSTQGGKIIGYGNAQSGNSGVYDRQVYIDNAGHVVFGVYPNSIATLSSVQTVNDGQWHQVVASLGSNGMSLYVDGVQVGQRGDVTSGQNYAGYWRVGGDNLGNWPNVGSSYLQGSIGDVAIFPTVLARSAVQKEYTASGRTLNVPSAPSDAYGATVFGDNPNTYWRMDDASGPTAADASGANNPGIYSGGESFQQPSPVTGSKGTGVTFNGVDGVLASQNSISAPTVYSEEAWFNTTTQAGGKLLGFGDQKTGNSNNYDRHVYMLPTGQLVFGTWTGNVNLAQSTASYNDGNWHYVVATQGPDGMTLYVDGQPVATNPQTQAQNYNGYWRVGGDTSWAGSNYFAGEIDEAAFYLSELTPAQVQTHYSASAAAVGTSNQPPVAKFTSSVSNLTASVDGSTSSDPDGTVESYSWNWGDGSPADSGATATHAYSSAGTYSVTLTVTDNKGATNSTSSNVSVTAPNQPPTAAFSSTSSNLTASFDASNSADQDGTIASYSWNWGDGSAAGSGKTATHAYTAAGAYQVTLTVTDDKGANGTVTQAVTVTKANQPPVAAFTSTTSGLTAAVDATTSSDPDGTIASYSWSWGDNSAAGSGSTASHPYGSAGTYQVTLTVTDNAGATNSVTRSVTVNTATVYASDSFGRNGTGKWGSADVGGAWTLTNSSLFGTNGTAGLVGFKSPGTSATALLNSVSNADVNELVDTTATEAATGTGTYIGTIARRIGTSDYRLKERLMVNGVVHLALSKVVNNVETTLREVNVTGLNYTPGMHLMLRFQVTGTSPTTLKGTIWAAGSAEPASPQISMTDSEAALQGPGGVGFYFYLSGTSTAPANVAVDNYSVVKPS